MRHKLRGALQCRSDSARPEGNAAYLLSSESSSSQADSALVSTAQPTLHTKGGRHFGPTGRGAYLSGAPTRECWPRATWSLPLAVQAHDDKHAAWAASHHLQERLAHVRTLPFSAG